MSGEPAIANGSSELSAAQQLMQKHGVEDHNPTVEEVVDEEDIAHPPPSMKIASETGSSAPSQPSQEVMSEKAAGKQPAADGPAASPAPSAPKSQRLEINSQDAFPSLGAAKPAQAAAAATWGKKPAAVGKSNGVNGSTNGSYASANASSRQGAPNSSFGTPSSGAPSAGVQLPGRYTERYLMKADALLKNNELKKPRKAIINDLNKRLKAKVTMQEGTNGLTLEATGSGPEVVRAALKAAAKELGSKVCHVANNTVHVASTNDLIANDQGSSASLSPRPHHRSPGSKY